MGRLMNPTVGDLFDRLLILALKVEECTALGVSSKHFKDEAVTIGGELERKVSHPTASMYCRIARLAAINGTIWFTEEAVKFAMVSVGDEVPKDPHIGVLKVLLQIRDLNRVRAQVIDAFDPTCGKEKTQ